MRANLSIPILAVLLAIFAQVGIAAQTSEQSCLRCHGLKNFSVLDPTEKRVRSLHIDPKAASMSAHKRFGCGKCHPRFTSYPHKPEWSKESATCESCHKRIARAAAATQHFHRPGTAHDHPGCIDCHGGDAHAVPPIRSWTRTVREAVCSRCHDDQALMDSYEVNSAALTAYHNSFHGRAHRLGLASAPVCDDCHTAHNIRPARDSASSVSHSNLPKTCGKCHKGVGAKFAVGSMHVGAVTGRDKPVVWTKIIYNLFVWAVILQFVVLIGFDLGRRYIDRRRNAVVDATKPGVNGRYFERFPLSIRLQHWVLIVSFFTLAATGLPLISPENEGSKLAIRLMGGMATRALLHRIAAIVMLGGGLAHIIWGSVTDRGRREIRELMPNLKDAGDALLLLGYYFGITAKPRYGRYSWVEKFEYFGVVWGSLVMAVTGIMLWFKEASTAIFPKWALDIAAVVHSYEGRLAFLTIIIWHFYNVIFSPDVFPASKVWLSGRISEHRMKEEHPLEYLKSQGTEESE